jgi:D-glycero-D-manno-heptose 1,7-bisphosphate phosphatase
MIFDPGYIREPKNIRLFFGIKEALRLFKKRGYLIIVLTNQSAIGRGYMTESELHQVHARLDAKLKECQPDAYYYCPHLPEDNCNCRKPNTGNLEKAIEDFQIDKEKSLVVGDKISDLALGEKFGIPAFLVLTGMGYQTLAELRQKGKESQAFAHLKDVADYFLLK